MKNYFIQVVLNTVDVLRELDIIGDYSNISSISSIEGSTILMDNDNSIELSEIDNVITVVYNNIYNGLSISKDFVWSEYLMDTTRHIKSLLNEVRTTEVKNATEFFENVKNLIITGLNLNDKNDIDDSLEFNLKFKYDLDSVIIYIHEESVLYMTTNVYHIQVPIVHIKDNPINLIEGVIKPYISFYNRFYQDK